MINKTLRFFVSLFDGFSNLWHNHKTEKILGTSIAFAYLFDIILIFLNNQDFLPHIISSHIQHNYYDAITVAFNLLLFFEVISLIITLPQSFSNSLVKQFEILSIILLRHAFEEIEIIEKSLSQNNIIENLYHMGSDSLGALAIFGGILVIKKLQKHRDVTRSKSEKNRFLKIKKAIAFILILVFTYFFFYDLRLFFNNNITFDFFKTFYSILILSDILMVLISLRYSQSYIVLFRNSGFAFATVLLRIALSSPVYINAFIGVAAIVFSIAIVLIYSNYKLENCKL